jgi:hypothetical protein
MAQKLTRRERREKRRQEEKAKIAKKKREQEELSRKTAATKFLWSFRLLAHGWNLVVVLSVIFGLPAGYVLFKPHVSVEPLMSLDPVNPYTVQFNIKNENSLLEIHDINAVCWPRRMESGNGFSVLSLGPLPNIHREIASLAPGVSGTVDCPPVIGGIGRWSGQVADAELIIDVSYKQSFWFKRVEELFPFGSRRDVQGAVHWVHITGSDLKPIFPTKR